MRKLKYILAVVLAVVTITCLIGCGDKKKEKETTSTEATTTMENETASLQHSEMVEVDNYERDDAGFIKSVTVNGTVYNIPNPSEVAEDIGNKMIKYEISDKLFIYDRNEFVYYSNTNMSDNHTETTKDESLSNNFNTEETTTVVEEETTSKKQEDVTTKQQETTSKKDETTKQTTTTPPTTTVKPTTTKQPETTTEEQTTTPSLADRIKAIEKSEEFIKMATEELTLGSYEVYYEDRYLPNLDKYIPAGIYLFENHENSIMVSLAANSHDFARQDILLNNTDSAYIIAEYINIEYIEYDWLIEHYWDIEY